MPPVREVVVTSFAEEGRHLGLRCVESMAAQCAQPVMVYRDHDEALAEWRTVRDRLPSTNPDADKPTNYIWNARKFAVKPFVWLAAAERLENGVLVWFDADTVAKQRISDGFFDDMLGDASVAYLGRGEMHPETGFVALRIPEALPLLRWCVQEYRHGYFAARLDGWTDCHILRAGMRELGMLHTRDLTSHLCENWTSSIDAFALSPLGPYVEHFKGPKRKREAVTA